MPEAMLPAIVVAVCSERGRSERAVARGEHGVNYGDLEGLSAWSVVVGVVRKLPKVAAACRSLFRSGTDGGLLGREPLEN